jgi:hypothetical protein
VIPQEDDEPDDFMERPEGTVSLIIWALCLPVYIPLYYTLPGSHHTVFAWPLCELVPDLKLKSIETC